ncbi:RNA-directed DNA polymerase [Micavibrio aeruginosavorus]|uniref:RNA-directed DNA polymerase n=1 Tax=Micavibrio aeruginosavorus TaxID=349221 RepID=UPI003F4A8F9B
MMTKHFIRALKNISKHGDTDVFPFPIENSIFYDCEEDVLALLEKIHTNFSDKLDIEPPFNENRLAPVGYSGFRWVTQLDPLWNAYILGLVISVGQKIENVRISVDEKCIFSYRFSDSDDEKIFNSDIGWQAFQQRSLDLAGEHSTVVVCDISDFYQRVRHHRLENALKQIKEPGDIPMRINKFLGNFSGKYSHGLPVGGPAARLLSEILLNQTDQLLKDNGIKFCRFADDYHLFCNSDEEAFDALLFLSEKLINNEGLTLQKSKTRIMSASEFKNISPLTTKEEDEAADVSAHNFMSLSLRFDPYSPTADEDYETLKSEIEKFDILGLLRREIGKSRIDIAVTRQIVKSLKFISNPTRDQAVLSVCNSLDNLYPIFPTIMMVLKNIWGDLSDETQKHIGKCIRDLFKDKSHLIKTQVNQAYACRLLSCEDKQENVELFTKLFNRSESAMIKRDIILAMFNWRRSHWLSDLRSQYTSFSPPLRRAFIIGSYSLPGDEGNHWRQANKGGFSDFEKIVQKWAASKTERSSADPWQVPL